MDLFDELLKELNSLDFVQKSIDWIEDLPDALWEKHFKDRANYKELDSKLDVYTHRWHETSVSVISIYGKILGIRHISNLFSEMSSCEDIHYSPLFMEMKEVTVVSYESV